MAQYPEVMKLDKNFIKKLDENFIKYYFSAEILRAFIRDGESLRVFVSACKLNLRDKV